MHYSQILKGIVKMRVLWYYFKNILNQNYVTYSFIVSLKILSCTWHVSIKG